jgi:hypothetical protein
MKCTLCNLEVEIGKQAAITAGWRFSEIHGILDNKYGVFCPAETLAPIVEKLKKDMESVTQGKRHK